MIEDMAEDPAEASEIEAEADSAVEIEKEDLLRCMMLSVINAKKNAKFHLNRQETSLSFAATASEQAAEAVQETADHLQGFLQNNSISLMPSLTR